MTNARDRRGEGEGGEVGDVEMCFFIFFGGARPGRSIGLQTESHPLEVSGPCPSKYLRKP